MRQEVEIMLPHSVAKICYWPIRSQEFCPDQWRCHKFPNKWYFVRSFLNNSLKVFKTAILCMAVFCMYRICVCMYLFLTITGFQLSRSNCVQYRLQNVQVYSSALQTGPWESDAAKCTSVHRLVTAANPVFCEIIELNMSCSCLAQLFHYGQIHAVV